MEQANPLNTDPAKTFLLSVGEARMEAQRVARKVERLTAQAEHITSELSGMPKSPSSDRERVLVALADMRGNYTKRLLDAEQQEQRVSDFIDALPTRENRMVLRLRYLDCLRWPSVVRRLANAGLKLEERQVYRIHGRAMAEARAAWPEWEARYGPS